MANESPLHGMMERAYALALADLPNAGHSRVWRKGFHADFSAVIRDLSVWKNFQNNGLTEGMGGPPFRDGAPREREILSAADRRSHIETYEALRAMLPAGFVDGLLFEGPGRPTGVSHGGRFLNLTELRNIYAAHRIFAYGALDRDRELCLVDIGGGHGGLAEKLARLYPRARIVLFDLPESCAIQTYFLGHVFGVDSLFTYEHLKARGWHAFFSGASRFALLPGEAIGALPPDSIDLFANMESMMEMDSRTVAAYFIAIQRTLKLGGAFYNCNRYHKPDVGEDIEIKRYPYDDCWAFTLSESKWRQPHIHELMGVRTALANAYPPRIILAGLPPHRWTDVATDFSAAFARFRAIVAGRGALTGNPGLWAVLQGKGERAVDPLSALRRRVGRLVRGRRAA